MVSHSSLYLAYCYPLGGVVVLFTVVGVVSFDCLGVNG